MNLIIILLLFKHTFSFGCEIDDSDSEFKKIRPNVGRVGYHCEYLGTVQRKIPEIKSENLISIGRIPKFGSNLIHTENEKQALLSESKFITTTTTYGISGTYNSIDQDGNLYLNSKLVSYENGTVRKLYKHVGSVGNYRGDVSDDEPAIIKKINIFPHNFGYSITGLYAPPGEIITVKISKKDLDALGDFTISIGQVFNNDQTNIISTSSKFTRMPLLTNTFKLNPNLFPHKRCIEEQCDTANNIDDYYQIVDDQKVTNTNYLKNVNCTESDYIFYVASFLGGPIYLKPTNIKSYTITIIGAVKYAHYIKGYTNEEEFEDNFKSTAPYIDLEIWQNGVVHSGPRNRSTLNNYEDFYEASLYWEKVTGVSHQFPSTIDHHHTINILYDSLIADSSPSLNGSINCPDNWLTYALGCKQYLIDSTEETWNIHNRYNYYFQKNWGFSNNGEISNNAINLVSYSLFTKISGRRTENNEIDGNELNKYTSASFAVSKAINEHDNDLVAYAVILHCFGQKLFIDTAAMQLKMSNDNWYTCLSNTTGLDLSYFFLKVYKTLIFSDDVISIYNTSQYKKFVPIASIYQTGVGYIVKGKRNEIHTMTPFRIEFGKDKILNFTEKMIVPNDIEFTIKNINQPEHGSIEKISDNVYKYHPDVNYTFSGKITMTIGLKNKEISDFPVDDVEMYFNFMQSYEVRDKFKNERVLDKSIYIYREGELPTDPVYAFQNNYPNHIDYVDIPNNNSIQQSNSEIWYYPIEYLDNRICELRGKTLVSAGKYRFALRGRYNVALFISTDEGKNYELAAHKTHGINAEYDLTNADTYHDYEFNDDTWIYFKGVLIQDTHSDKSILPFIGVGMGKFDEEGNVEIKHLNNAYEQSYQPIPEPEFTSENPFPRIWREKYTTESKKGTLMKYSYNTWENSNIPNPSYNISNLFDDNDNNYIHQKKYNPINASNPFSVTVDMGEVIEANLMKIYGTVSKNYQPRNFTLYLGTDIDDLKLALEVTDAYLLDTNVYSKFNTTQFRYYQLNVTDTYCTSEYKYISYRYLTFSFKISGTAVSLDDDRVTLYNSWTKKNRFCTFGNIYVGEFNSKLVFKFNGTSISIKAFSSPEFGSFFVYIDGVKVKYVNLNTDLNRICIVFSQPCLEDKEHTLTICGFTKFNIDSFIIGEDLSTFDELIDDVYYTLDESIEPTLMFTPSSIFTKSSKFSYSNVFTPSDQFSNSLTFTSSKAFTISEAFTQSDSFINQNIHPQATKRITLSKSYSLTYVYKKSVTHSISFIVSNTFYMSYFENENSYSLINTQIDVPRYYPYIIQYLSPLYLETIVQMTLKNNKARISPEQLIGVVCGSVSVFFLILAIIILIVRRKYYIQMSDSFDISCDDSSEPIIYGPQHKKSEIVENLTETDIESQYKESSEIDASTE